MKQLHPLKKGQSGLTEDSMLLANALFLKHIVRGNKANLPHSDVHQTTGDLESSECRRYLSCGHKLAQTSLKISTAVSSLRHQPPD